MENKEVGIMMRKNNYRIFVERIRDIMEIHGEVTVEISPKFGYRIYTLNNTPFGKLRVYIEEFKTKQNKQYMCLTLSEPAKLPDDLISKNRLHDGFNNYTGKYMKWCSTFEYMENWFRNLIECIFEMEV